VLEVRPAAQGAGPDNDVFLTVEATLNRYVQAQIVVIVRLYVSVQVANATLSDLQATGAVVEARRRQASRRDAQRTWLYGVRATHAVRRAERNAHAGAGRLRASCSGAATSDATDARHRAHGSQDPALAADIRGCRRAAHPERAVAADPPVFHAGEPLPRTPSRRRD
jgi:hypothetical protein